MSIRRWVLSASVLSVVAASMPHPSAAQGILARVKKLGGSTAAAGKKVVIDEANGEINSAVQDAAAEHVADGSFIAVLSPWSSAGVAKRVEVARFSGDAFVVTSPSGRQIMLCDSKSTQSWLASFAIPKKAPGTLAGAGAASGANAHAGATRNGGGTGGAGKTHAAAPAPSNGGAHGGAHGGAQRGGNTAHAGNGTADSSKSESDSDEDSEPDPFTATNENFSFPSNFVTITLPATGAQSGKPSRGSLKVADVSQTVLGGAGKIRFSQATIPGENGPQVVDMGVTFKARVMPPGDAPVGCGTGAGKGSPSGKSPGGANASSAPAAATSSGTSQTQGPAFAEGDVLLTKIGNVKVFAASNDSAKVAATVNVGDALVYLGQEENGYVHVQGAAGEGWVRKALVSKR